MNFFFKANKKRNAIQKIYSSNTSFRIENLSERIRQLDLLISETSQSIFEAQIVRIRAFFSTNRNFLERFQRKMVENSLNKSLLWHQKRMIKLTKERQLLQDELDRITGKYWPKRFKNLFYSILISISFLLIFFIFIAGIIATIYMIPFFLFFVLSLAIFRIFHRKNNGI